MIVKTPMQAIRRKCKDCCSNQTIEIKTCSALNCPVWQFRLGLHPFTKKNEKNSFLQCENFIGLQNKAACEVIRIIKAKTKETL